MPTRDEILEQMQSIICDELGVDPEEVTPNASFIDDLGADSLDLIELVMQFEERFGIEIDDDTADSFVTVSDVLRYLDPRLS